jgi:DNA replication licensing factor MCM3
MLHGNRPKSEKIVSVKFMKKYIHVAKSIKPELTDEASAAISEAYSKLRSFEREQEELARTQPITPRALETLIRLATAHAKGRMSKYVDIGDANSAIELAQFAYFKKIIEKPKKVKREHGGSDGEEMATDDEEVIVPRRKREAPKDVFDFDDEESLKEEHSSAKRKAKLVTQVTAVVELTTERLKEFKKLLNEEFRRLRAEKLVLNDVNASMMKAGFSEEETSNALDKMQEDNQIMVADGDVFLI